MTLPRERGLTEQAADVAVDTACRMLRLPSIRKEFPVTNSSAPSVCAPPPSVRRAARLARIRVRTRPVR